MASGFTGFLRNLIAPKAKGEAAPPRGAAVDYKGYAIQPASHQEGTQWITAAVISKQLDDGMKEKHFIRADMFSTKDDADECSINKAKRIIDELGDRLFDVG